MTLTTIMNPLFLTFVIVATIAATAGLTATNSTITSMNPSNTATLTATFTTSAYAHHDHGAVSAATSSFKNQHGRLTVVENNAFFQIHSSEKSSLCIEAFKSLENVGRLWLRPCKSKGEHGVERQTFSVTNDGKLYPSTKPSSCLFLYNNKMLRYRKDCVSILHHQKNQFMFNFFDGTIFLMGDVTKVMTAQELQEKKEVKLQRGSSSKSTKQQWTLRFEKDRVLRRAAKRCNSPPPKKVKTLPPMPSGTYPPSPKSTNTPTTLLPARPPVSAYPPTTYQQIKNYFNIYVNIWLKNNMEGEHATDAEKDVYHELVAKYG